MLKLTPAEQQWLSEYRQTLTEQFPGIIEQLTIFGSKARGEATEDSDLDVLIIIREGDWKLKEAIARPGHLAAVGTDVVPSFIVYTVNEWEQRRQAETPLWQTVMRDGVAV
jgi:predicted nucleotidyltransferase